MFIKLLMGLIIFLMLVFVMTQIILPIFEKKLPLFWMFKTKRIKEAAEMKKAAEEIAEDTIEKNESLKNSLDSEIEQAKTLLSKSKE